MEAEQQPKFVQLYSDGPESPLYALDAESGVWELVVKLSRDPVSGYGTGIERYWRRLEIERR